MLLEILRSLIFQENGFESSENAPTVTFGVKAKICPKLSTFLRFMNSVHHWQNFELETRLMHRCRGGDRKWLSPACELRKSPETDECFKNKRRQKQSSTHGEWKVLLLARKSNNRKTRQQWLLYICSWHTEVSISTAPANIQFYRHWW